ncbi:uncharacterized protein LOC119403578 [Rhipicephalus sanguineus]|uniref:uncharacterized protein LOC119403578 n=1 Tax=Rhipicephalus sanguineus TaxID=34632 RepID=UPI001893C57C|nr:uncharacterized protein LOC119403578 [Rhipicephalus sanguineus]
MGSRSTLEPEDDYGSFTDEYSVRIEVYETEVTDSGGSAPIIKISGLCNTDDPVPYLIGQQCRSRFATADQATKCSATHVYKDQLPRFQSLQLTENNEYYRGSAKSTSVEKDNKAACQTRCVPRSRKTTTIPSRLSRSLWDAENQRRRRSECTYTLDRLPRSTCSCVERVTRHRLHCIEETVTTRHLPAVERRRLVRHHACETSLQEGWACTDLCAVYRILPPEKNTTP